MRNRKKPNHDAFHGFPLVPEALVAELRKVFPSRPVLPASSPTDIYYEAGVQKVIDYLADIVSKQKEQADVFRPEDPEG
jgi:hypothetical protein